MAFIDVFPQTLNLTWISGQISPSVARLTPASSTGSAVNLTGWGAYLMTFYCPGQEPNGPLTTTGVPVALVDASGSSTFEIAAAQQKAFAPGKVSYILQRMNPDTVINQIVAQGSVTIT